MITVLGNELAKRQGSPDPAAFDVRDREQRVDSGGVVTLIPSEEQRTYTQPEPLPQGPLPVARRRSRR